MRDHVRAFVETAALAFDLSGPVYEFGAYQVEGQEALADLRQFFPGREYTGCDMRVGPGVDRIEDLSRLTIPSQTVRTIVCVDTLEHVFEARRAVDEMLRVLAPGGVLLLAAPLDFRLHDYPSDYWRLTPACMSRLLEPLEGTLVGWQGPEKHPHTVFGIGVKAPAGRRFARGAQRFLDLYQQWLDESAAAIPWTKKLKQLAVRWFRGKGERQRIEQYHTARFALHLPSSCLASDLVPDGAQFAGSRIDEHF